MTTNTTQLRWQRGILVAVVVVLVLASLVSIRLVQELRATNQNVLYEDAERLRNVEALSTAVYNRSASARGFLLSGDASFLEARRTARAEIARRLSGVASIRTAEATSSLEQLEGLYARLDTATTRAIATFATSPELARADWEDHARPIQFEVEKVVATLLAGQVAAFENARRTASEASEYSLVLVVSLLASIAVVVSVLLYAYARLTRSLLAQQRAEQQQATFRLLDQVPVGIFVSTPDGKPFYANQHATRLLGQGIVDLGTNGLARTYRIYEVGMDHEYPNERLPLVRALAGETSEVTDIEIRREDDVIPLHVTGAPVYDSSGALLYAVAGFQDVRELQRVSMRDVLTGLVNRRALAQAYGRDQALAQRRGQSVAVSIIDLDRFKLVNDAHGHAAGDDVLKQTAATLVKSLRRTDMVGRWGGEELAIVMPDSDARGAMRAVENALRAVRSLEFRGAGETRFSVTFSAGVVVALVDETLDAAIARADKLLYKAKEAGRDRVLSESPA